MVLKKILRNCLLGLVPCIPLTAFGQSATDFIVPSSTKPHVTSGKKTFHSNYLIFHGTWNHQSGDNRNAELLHGPRQATVQGYHPSDILSAYNIPAGGGSQAIAIIDAFDLPTNLSDFNTFSREFGLPTETSTVATASTNKVLQVVYSGGAKPAKNGDWGGEIALDIEWAHALAPNAKIYLVECPSDAISDLLNGAQYASQNLPNVKVISMSFGGNEDPSQTQYDSVFTHPFITYMAAAGDIPNAPTYPATSPNVVSVGGTSLDLINGSVASESYWFQDNTDGGAAGKSAYELRPSYQNSIAAIVGANRGINDISADGDPSTGCAVYDSTPVPSDSNSSGWLVFGGTSLACPICAGITNDRAYFPANSFSQLTFLYSLAGTARYRDITTGSSGTLKAAVGYDLLTGLGVPLGIFPNHTLKLSAASLVTGVGTLGIPDNIILKDNHLYDVRSINVSGTQRAIIGAAFTGGPAPQNAISGTVTITGTNAEGACQVLALNTKTNAYDVVGTLSLGIATTTTQITIPNIQNYLTSSGGMRLEVSSSLAGTIATKIGIDSIVVAAETLS